MQFFWSQNFSELTDFCYPRFPFSYCALRHVSHKFFSGCIQTQPTFARGEGRTGVLETLGQGIF